MNMSKAAHRRGDTKRDGSDPRKVDYTHIDAVARSRAKTIAARFKAFFTQAKKRIPFDYDERVLRAERRRLFKHYGRPGSWHRHNGAKECARRLRQRARDGHFQ